MCVLAVGDDELDVRHDDNASSLVAKRGVSRAQETQWMGSNLARQLQVTSIPRIGTTGTKTCLNNIFVFIFEFYSLI